MSDIVDTIIARESACTATSTEVSAGIEIVLLRSRIITLEQEINELRQSRNEWSDRALEQQRRVTELLCEQCVCARGEAA